MKGKICLLFFSLFSWAIAWSQTRQVTGRVVSDSANAPLAAASVTIQGTTTAVATNNEGRYSINIPDRNDVVLTFSSVGYTTQNVPVGNKSTVNATLVSSATALSDVVVIGYQTVRRKDLTGSVSSINARQLKDVPINNAAQALAGRLAGVQITGTEGSPDAAVNIRVRGGGSITQDNSPLYIIDGVQMENALSVISPQDIESIDVLKDASATAIYGARGANGVVIITTKGGRNQKPVLSYNGSYGIDKLANKLDVLNPYDFVLYQYERSRGNSADERNFQNTYGRFEDLELYKYVPFVDWQEEMFGRVAQRQTHNVSLSGGNQGTTYNLSLTYNKQEGVQLGSDFDRKLVSFKFDHRFSNVLRVGFNTRFNNTNVNGAGTSDPGSSATNRLRNSIKYRPFLVPGQNLMDYDADYAAETNANSLALVNPILLNQAEYRKKIQNSLNLSGYADIKFTDYLSFRSTLGIDRYGVRQDQFDDTITYRSRSQSSSMPIASISNSERVTLNNSNVLTFNNSHLDGDFNRKNRITFLVGQEIYQQRTTGQNIAAKEFPIGISPEKAIENMGLGTAFIDDRPSYQYDEHLLSFFGRLMYDFDQRILTQFTFRADGSSKFAEGHKWGYFPSGSVAWRISNERFFDRLKPSINDLKLRVSYGEAGNNRIGNTLYATQFNSSASYWLNNQLVSAFEPDELANERLKWETTVSRNIGLDVALLHNRLQFSIDAYRNSTKDLLVQIPVPTNAGYETQTQNVGTTEGKGVELQLSYNIFTKKNFNWTANFNASFGRVKVKSLGSDIDFYLKNSGWGFKNTPADFIVKEGEYLGSMYGFVTDGFYTLDMFDYSNGTYTLKPDIANNKDYTSADPAPGRLKFKDLNGDGLITEADKTIIGVAQPKVFGGLNNQFQYKNFDLSVFINYQFGNDVYNANKLEFTSGYQGNANLLQLVNNRWRTINAQGNVVTDPQELAKLNANATMWIPPTSSTSFLLHSWAVEDGSFVRINNVTLGYTLPENVLSRLHLRTARVYVTGNNLAVLTSYSGYDPEVSTRRSTPETPGVDYSAYPRSRTFIVGVNLSL